MRLILQYQKSRSYLIPHKVVLNDRHELVRGEGGELVNDRTVLTRGSRSSSLSVVNDCAERGVKLIQEFVE